MNENPLMILLYVGVAVYVGQIYWGDYKTVSRAKRMLVPCLARWRLLSVPLSLERSVRCSCLGWKPVASCLGLVDEQSVMVWFFVFAAMAAGVVER